MQLYYNRSHDSRVFKRISPVLSYKSGCTLRPSTSQARRQSTHLNINTCHLSKQYCLPPDSACVTNEYSVHIQSNRSFYAICLENWKHLAITQYFLHCFNVCNTCVWMTWIDKLQFVNNECEIELHCNKMQKTWTECNAFGLQQYSSGL